MRIRTMACLLAVWVLSNAQASTFSYYCDAKVDCKNLLTDIVTDKFTAKYDVKRWTLFVRAETVIFGDGSGAATAFAGTVPRQDGGRFRFYPIVTQSAITVKSKIGNSFDQLAVEKAVIRQAVEGLMALCESKADCVLD